MKALTLLACGLLPLVAASASAQGLKKRAVLKGHSGQVFSMAFSPDSKLLASASGRFGQPGELKVWDATSGMETASLQGHKDAVVSVAFSPDGGTLASASHDGTARLWDHAGRKQKATLDIGDYVRAVAWTADGKTLAVGTVKGDLLLIDAASGKQRALVKAHPGGINSLAFGANDKTVAAGGGFGRLAQVTLWEVATGKEAASFKADSGPLSSVRITPDGKTLAAASTGYLEGGKEYRAAVMLWDAATGKQRRAILKRCASIALSPDGRTVAAGPTLWDAATGEELGAVGFGANHCVEFSPDGNTLAVGAAELELWDVSKLRKRK